MVFKDTASKLCYIAPYCAIMNKYGFDMAEEYLFGAAKGIAFKYSYIHENKKAEKVLSCNDWISIEGANDIKKNIKDSFGVQFYTYLDNNNDNILDFCEKELKEKREIIIYLDVFYLKYHPEYKKTHAQTNVILYEISNTKTEFYIYDQHVTTVPVSIYRGVISKSEFITALINGNNIFNDEKIGLIAHTCNKSNCNINLWKSIAENAEDMINPDSPYSGIQGIQALADEIIKWEDYWNKSNLNKVFRQAYLHITGRGGAAISREVYGDFLKEYCRTESFDIMSISEGFKKTSKKWNAIAVKFFRGSLNINKCSLNQISNCFIEISELERKLFTELKLIGETVYDKNY